jgi:hypothetical protein
MATVEKRKAEQAYKTTPETCANCGNMTCNIYHYEDHRDSAGRMQRVKVQGKGDGTNPDFQNTFRCSIGEFAVKKMATCKLWIMKPANAELCGERSESERTPG